MKNLIYFTILLVGLEVQAQQELTIKADLNKLTVYSSSAEMNYQGKVDLKRGRTTLKLEALSPYIVANSINVSLANSSIKIISVTEKLNFLVNNKLGRNAALNDSIGKIQQRIKYVSSEIQVLTSEKTLLFKDESLGGVSLGVSVETIEKASNFYRNRLLDIEKRLIELNSELAHLKSAKITIHQQMEENGTQGSKKESSIHMVVESSSNQSTEIAVKFLVNNAGWAPLYDLKYKGIGENLEIVFRANLFNATDVDWKDVNLKLSTANPLVGFDMPGLNQDSKRSRALINYKGQQIKFRQVKASTLLADYNISYKSSIPSDGRPYLQDVAEYEAAADFSYIVIPVIDNQGFLMANIPNWSQFNLLSGTTNVYNNGTYMGKTFLETLTDNDTLRVYLGKDNNIQAFRKEDTREYERKVVGNYYVDKTKIGIEVKNTNQASVDIELVDQVPDVYSDDDYKINLNGISEDQINKSNGEVRWYFSLAPGESRPVNFGYSLKYEKGLSSVAKPKRRKFRQISSPAF